MKKRQKLYWKLLRPLVIVFLYIKFRYTFKTAKNLPEKFILLSNHNTDFDPLFVGVSFRNGMRFVASEHISRWKRFFGFVNHVFSPIMRPKGTNAASTVKEMLRALRNGDNVCMFAEGARSWNGVTAPVLPSTGKLVKSSKVALVTYKISGGYFSSPLWSENGTRKGKMHGEVVKIYSAEEIASMTVSQINEIIRNDLFEDAYQRQSKEMIRYKGKNLAVKMETMLFCCPECCAMESLVSNKDEITCTKCNHTFKYDEYGNIKGLDQKNIKELFYWLKLKVEADAKDGVSYFGSSCSISKIHNHQETLIFSGDIEFSESGLVYGDVCIPYEEIDDFSMHGKYALLYSTKDGYFEIIVPKNISALKFYMLFLAYKYNIIDRFSF